MSVKTGTCGFPISRKKYYNEFKVIELNNTFYSIPNIEWLKKLREEAPKDFEFTFKAFQGITHDITSPTWKRSNIKDYKNLKNKVGFLRPTKEVFEFWEKQIEIAKILRSEIIIIQLPNSFRDSRENIKNANDFFSTIKREIKIGIELRGWSNENIRKLCETFDLIDVTDPLHRQPIYDSKIKYYRLHGKYENNKIIYNHDYTNEELRNIKKIVDILHREKTYVMFNNSYMYKNAKEFLLLNL